MAEEIKPAVSNARGADAASICEGEKVYWRGGVGSSARIG
jgi:hypothetical protein